MPGNDSDCNLLISLIKRKRRNRKTVITTAVVIMVSFTIALSWFLVHRNNLRLKMHEQLSYAVSYIEHDAFFDALLHALDARGFAERLRDNDYIDIIDTHIDLTRAVISADIFFNEGQYKDALNSFISASRISRMLDYLAFDYIEENINTTEGYIMYFSTVAEADDLAERGDFEAALLLYEELLILANDLSFASGEQHAASGVHEMEEQIALAIRIAMELEAQEQMLLAEQAISDEEFAKAIEFFQNAILLFREIGNQYDLNAAYTGMLRAERMLAESLVPDDQGDGDPVAGDSGSGEGGSGQMTLPEEFDSIYDYNLSLDFDLRTMIDHQNRMPASQVIMGSHDGRNEGWYNGCGWIATYNALIRLGSPQHPADIVRYFEESGGTVFGGVFGTYPNAIERFFRDLGYNVNHKLLPGARVDIDNEIKTAGIGILAYAHTSAAHYVMIEYRESDDKFIVYNDSSARTRSRELGFHGSSDEGAVIDSVAAFLRETSSILFSFSLVTVW